MRVPVLLSSRSPLLLRDETWPGVILRLVLHLVAVVVVAAVVAVVGLAAVAPWVAQ